jgi:hypothetical protein
MKSGRARKEVHAGLYKLLPNIFVAGGGVGKPVEGLDSNRIQNKCITTTRRRKDKIYKLEQAEQ